MDKVALWAKSYRVANIKKNKNFINRDHQKRHQRCSVKNVALKIFSKFAGKASNFIKKETLVQMFSCEFCKIFKNTLFIEYLRATTFGLLNHIEDSFQVVILFTPSQGNTLQFFKLVKFTFLYFRNATKIYHSTISNSK